MKGFAYLKDGKMKNVNVLYKTNVTTEEKSYGG